MGVRLVVSGQNKDGKSIIVSDEIREPVEMGIQVTSLWGSDNVPRFPMSGQREECSEMFTGAGGYRLLMFTLPPNFEMDKDPSSEAANQVGTGALDVVEPGTSGMHTTDTVDFEVVLSGEVSIELDDGITTHLKAGDFFVQNGTRHRWFNRGDVSAVVVACVIGGELQRK